jgi:hypothetical protein
MHLAGVPVTEIATTLGYTDSAAVWTDVKVALKRVIGAQSTEVDELRCLELARLDDLLHRAIQVADREHAVLYQGADTGFKDDGPVLAAVHTVLKIMQQRARLLGLDAPTRLAIDGAVRYELVGVDVEKLT